MQNANDTFYAADFPYTLAIVLMLLGFSACSTAVNSELSSIHAPSNRWSDGTRYNLSYCIDKPGFGYNYDAIRHYMIEATTEWEKYADVKFKHQREYDENCQQSSFAVLFPVIPKDDENYPRGSAFFPNSPPNTRQLYLNLRKDLFKANGEGTRTLHNIIRHELGHILGLEHAHDPSSAATVGVKDEYSIMHYPWMGRFGSWDKHPGLSFWDKVAVNRLYPQKVFGFEDSNFNHFTNWFTSNETMKCPTDHAAYGLRCKGDYCSDLRILCRKVPSNFLSKIPETEGPSHRVMVGIKCEGKYCSHIEPQTQSVNIDSYANSLKTDACYESIPFTDQSNDPVLDHAICRQDELMTNVTCKDGKCDTIAITCCPLRL